MELIRQKRDSNFVKGLKGDSVGWLDGLDSGEYRIDAKDMIYNKRTDEFYFMIKKVL